MSSSAKKASSVSASASSSRMSSPAPNQASAGPSTQSIDPYRPLATQVKKPLLPLFPTEPPNLPSLLHLDASTYSSRLSGKTLQSSDPFPPAAASGSGSGFNMGTAATTPVSALVKGKKRNRGHPTELAKARNEVQRKQKAQQDLGLEGMRKIKRRLGPTMGRGMRVSYNALLPLHHMHTTYLIQLLSLPPMPSPQTHSGLMSTSSPSLSVGRSSPALIPNTEPILSKLSKADFTGIKLSVLSSRNLSLEGISGIVIEETASTFRLVTVQDRVKVIPKDGTQFRLLVPAYSPVSPSTLSSTSYPEQTLPPAPTPTSAPISQSVSMTTTTTSPMTIENFLVQCPHMEIDLLGTAFAYRSGDRAGRKFRPAQGGGGGSGWAEGWVKTDWSDVFDDLEVQLGEVARDSGNRHQSGNGQRKEKIISNGAVEGVRKRGKSRRKDPPAGGNRQLH